MKQNRPETPPTALFRPRKSPHPRAYQENRSCNSFFSSLLEPMLRELAHLSSREIAAELAKRGHKISYRTVQRALARLKVE
jgi:hypothetical protein